MLAVHLLCAACAFATALVCRQIARRVADEAAGWWAAVLYAVFSVGFYSKMQAANTEMFAVLPTALAVLVYLKARGTWRRLYFVASGVLAGIAILFKQPAVLVPVALAAGGLVQAWRRGQRLVPEVVAGAALAAGSLATLALAGLYLFARGILDDAVFWTWTYIWRYYFPAVQDSLVIRLLSNVVPLVLSMTPAVLLAALARGREPWPIRWWLAGMIVAGFVGGRMYGHYFLLAVPPLCVLAGVGATRLWSAAAPARRWLKRGVVVVTALLAAGQLVGATLYEGATDSFWSPRPDYARAAAYLRTVTRPDERVFVWGWFPALYVAGQRCPSTRFVYAHHLAGMVSDPSGRRGHSVPLGWQEVMDDLRRNPPAYVLDTSHGDYEFRYAPIERYAPLWSSVNRSYTFETEIAGVRFYRRQAR
jgi:4-amino-4-deoxy-L-arabinose transferase-like glycosyltransferase